MEVESLMSSFISLPSKLAGFIACIWQNESCFYPKVILLGAVGTIASVKIYQDYKRNQRRKKWNSLGNDVVVLHGFSRGKMISNLSPFIMKVETYLRMAGLKYEFESEEYIGPKTKTPWITMNGEEVGDSDIILDYLSTRFNLNFSKNLTQEQRAVARALSVMADEHMFWGLIDWRFIRDPKLSNKKLADIGLPPYFRFLKLLPFGSRFLKNKCKMQGFGFHTTEEKNKMIIKDIESISLYLGKKKFLMGDTPCEVDCTIFGMVAQFVWTAQGSAFHRAVEENYTNLIGYCNRMKETFYPDWNELLMKH